MLFVFPVCLGCPRVFSICTSRQPCYYSPQTRRRAMLNQPRVSHMLARSPPQGKYVVPKYSKSAIAGHWVLMWQNTGAVFRLCLNEDLQFESVDGLGTGHLGGRWNTWDADRCEEALIRALESHVGQLREGQSTSMYYKQVDHWLRERAGAYFEKLVPGTRDCAGVICHVVIKQPLVRCWACTTVSFYFRTTSSAGRS